MYFFLKKKKKKKTVAQKTVAQKTAVEAARDIELAAIKAVLATAEPFVPPDERKPAAVEAAPSASSAEEETKSSPLKRRRPTLPPRSLSWDRPHPTPTWRWSTSACSTRRPRPGFVFRALLAVCEAQTGLPGDGTDAERVAALSKKVGQ